MIPMQTRILIVDDEKIIRESLAEGLQKEADQVDIASDAKEAIVKMNSSPEPYNIVITDLKMPGMSGEELLKWIKDRYPRTDVLMITAFGTFEVGVNAIKQGASDIIQKPIDLFLFKKQVRELLERQQLLAENRELRNQLLDRNEVVVGTSLAIREIYETVDRVANTDATVLIEGASGTGKEVIARAIHLRSYRRNKPFVVINCAALPSTLLENELFGHEKEAFTGAVTLKKGRFEQANGGTIFLDEITEMSLENQSGFLRVLEDGCFHRVGGSQLIRVNTRVIAASNRNVLKACQEGKFRYDLYYRLNVVPIYMPLLKQRVEDIPILIQDFISRFARKYNYPDLKIDAKAIEMLKSYSWPGNVRELKNVIERAVILSRGEEITEQHFPGILNDHCGKRSTVEVTAGKTLQEMEAILIRETLEAVSGHRKRAAEMLGISVRTLHNKIKKYHLENNGKK